MKALKQPQFKKKKKKSNENTNSPFCFARKRIQRKENNTRTECIRVTPTAGKEKKKEINKSNSITFPLVSPATKQKTTPNSSFFSH